MKNVSSADYGSYECVAKNEEGLDRLEISLNVTSRPDEPQYLKVTKTTYKNVTLSWESGFNGGFEQTFKIR